MGRLIFALVLALLVACQPGGAPVPPSSPPSTSQSAVPSQPGTPSSSSTPAPSTEPTTGPTETPEPSPLPEPAPQPPLPSPVPPAPTTTGCAAPTVCITADSGVQLKITRPGVYDGQHHLVPNILIRSSGVTVQHFKISGGIQAGIWSEGANNLLADNEISNIGYGSDDVDAIRFFGNGTVIRGNWVHNLIRGPLRPNQQPHPDCVQTYAHSLPGSSDVQILANRCESLDLHQCVMAEGPGSTDGGGGGGGQSARWLIQGNTCGTISNQAIALRGIGLVQVIGNQFTGTYAKAIQSTDGTTVTARDNVLGPNVRALIGD